MTARDDRLRYALRQALLADDAVYRLVNESGDFRFHLDVLLEVQVRTVRAMVEAGQRQLAERARRVEELNAALPGPILIDGETAKRLGFPPGELPPKWSAPSGETCGAIGPDLQSTCSRPPHGTKAGRELHEDIEGGKWE